MLDLKNKKYEMIILKKYIYSLDLVEVLQTQVLTKEFVLNYILNKDFQLTKEENNISLEDVLYFQPHLLKTDLINIYESNLKRNNSFDFLKY
jgi:hypothetical protein